jgi:hypothetical protein
MEQKQENEDNNDSKAAIVITSSNTATGPGKADDSKDTVDLNETGGLNESVGLNETVILNAIKAGTFIEINNVDTGRIGKLVKKAQKTSRIQYQEKRGNK